MKKRPTAAEVLDARPHIDVVSLDFFDTLVTRSVAQPTHVFAEVERLLVNEFGREWNGYAQTRVRVEHEVRVRVAATGSLRDISHDEIMKAMQLHYSATPEFIERARRLECECEIAMARAVPFGCDIANEARARGLRVVIVSDNYMSSEFLAHMAGAAGLAWVQASDIFVSCEHGGMKQNGTLWKTVVEILGVSPKNMVHVGDHRIPDGTEPSKLGIHCYIDSRSSRWHRHSLNTSPAVLPFSRLEAWQRDVDNEWFRGAARHFGDGVVAMMVAAQVKDCLDVLASRTVAGIHFAARDGWMADSVWFRLRLERPELPEATYLSFSRSVIGRANITHVDDDVAVRFVDENERLTPRRLSTRFGCDFATSLGIDDEMDSSTARQLVVQNGARIIEASRQLRERVVGHLRTHGVLTPGHHIVFDLGWRGSSMADLADIVSEATNGATTIEGRFLGLYWDATMNRTRLSLHGYAMDDLGSLDDNIRLLGAVRLFEFLVTAPNGSVIDFHGAEKNFEPIHASQKNRPATEDAFIGVILATAVDAALQIILGTHPSGVTANDITPHTVWAAMMQVAHTPRADELDALQEHVHVASVDHADGGIPLLAPAPKWSSTFPVQRFASVYDDTMKTRWFQGSLREWERHDSSRDFADAVTRIWPFMGPVWCDAP
jgi:FMN phosphatase YigB (HAD superfamily)